MEKSVHIENRKQELIEKRRNLLLEKSTEDLAIAVSDYFNAHACLPGQKALKDAAENTLRRLREDPEFELIPTAKAYLAESLANVAVREVKVGNLKVQNITKMNRDDYSVLKPTNLNLREAGSESGKPPRCFLETDAFIAGRRVLANGYEVGLLPEGFAKNNPNLSAPALLILTDYSLGKLANVSYHVIIDLLDAPFRPAPETSLQELGAAV